ncbi:MAG: methyl-accepting chemotaxis protein, partial [Bacillota bacterium]
ALNDVLSEINSASDQVACGTLQVSEASQSQSQGATEQASALEELSASITQIAVQTKQNAENARKANELSVAAKEGALDGNRQMQAMLESMREINEASGNIGKIIKVIDDIAFQTNILALNAAVEAARAGAHGKGFAVVAEEVRNLAVKSADAANETTALIEGSIRKAEAGTQIANGTANALAHIVEDVEKAVELVGDIACASEEQAAAIGQVHEGIEQVSQVVQNNASTAEESAAASEELSGQAERLKGLVHQFKLKNNIKSLEYEGKKEQKRKMHIILNEEKPDKYCC